MLHYGRGDANRPSLTLAVRPPRRANSAATAGLMPLFDPGTCKLCRHILAKPARYRSARLRLLDIPAELYNAAAAARILLQRAFCST
jgi:hypothetical protein